MTGKLVAASSAGDARRWVFQPMKRFPAYYEAPDRLFGLDGHCGPLVCWGILTYFKIKVPSNQIIRACGYTKRYGVFALPLAVALRDFGLKVTYYSQCDFRPSRFEKQAQQVAHSKGVQFGNAISLKTLLKMKKINSIQVVLFDTPEGDGHFSPIEAGANQTVLLPYSKELQLDWGTFMARWKAKGILKQCLVVSK